MAVRNPDTRRLAGEDWADQRETMSSAYEPTYPDGSVRHECWNASQLRPTGRKPSHPSSAVPQGTNT